MIKLHIHPLLSLGNRRFHFHNQTITDMVWVNMHVYRTIWWVVQHGVCKNRLCHGHWYNVRMAPRVPGNANVPESVICEYGNPVHHAHTRDCFQKVCEFPPDDNNCIYWYRYAIYKAELVEGNSSSKTSCPPAYNSWHVLPKGCVLSCELQRKSQARITSSGRRLAQKALNPESGDLNQHQRFYIRDFESVNEIFWLNEDKIPVGRSP